MTQPHVPLHLPIELMTMPRQFDAAFNGKVYVGKVDTDPTAPANQITVFHEAENSQLIPVAQPISINTGGYPVINGQVVKLVVDQDYAIAVYDRLGAQVYYFPRCTGPYILNVFHDQTLHGTGAESDPLGVQLSPDNGNLLEIRNNGLYYGTIASDDLLNLYVDGVNGNDANKGTRAEPLKTLNEALKRTPNNKSNTIHLHAGQTFILDVRVEVVSCTRTITAYNDPYVDGDKVPAVTPENPAYAYWASVNIARPTIKTKVDYSEKSHVFVEYEMWLRAGAILTLAGVILDTTPVNDDQQQDWQQFNGAPIYGDSTTAVNLYGCLITTKARSADKQAKWCAVAGYSDGSMPSVNLCRCVFLRGDSLIDLMNNGGRIVVRDDWPIQFGMLYNVGNITATIKGGKLDGIVRGPSGEPRNLMLSFVV